MKRLRLGIILIIVSWLPFAQLLINNAHDKGQLQDSHSADVFRLIIWGIQIVIGLIGLFLVGELAVKAAKSEGWRKTPRLMWQLFWHGSSAS